jgi:hypothetical protein
VTTGPSNPSGGARRAGDGKLSWFWGPSAPEDLVSAAKSEGRDVVICGSDRVHFVARVPTRLVLSVVDGSETVARPIIAHDCEGAIACRRGESAVHLEQDLIGSGPHERARSKRCLVCIRAQQREIIRFETQPNVLQFLRTIGGAAPGRPTQPSQKLAVAGDGLLPLSLSRIGAIRGESCEASAAASAARSICADAWASGAFLTVLGAPATRLGMFSTEPCALLASLGAACSVLALRQFAIPLVRTKKAQPR